MTNDFVIPDRRGLVGEWLLNGDTKDTSGNGYGGTPLNVTYSITNRGYQRYAGNFNGSSSKVDTGYGGLTNNFSISIVLTKGDSDGVAFSMHNSWCRIYSDGTVQANFYDGADRYISSSPGYVTDSKPHHLVWVKTSTNGQALWLDGVKVAENTSHNGTLSAYTGSPGIGYFRTFNAHYTSASIQSVRIFNRALSETEIRNWYLESLRALGGSTLSDLMSGVVAQINTTDGNELSDIVGGVAVTKTSGTATTDNLGYARAITNPNYSWPSVTYTTGYAFENAGSGWVLTQTPSGLSATGINRTTTLREIFLFNRTLSADEKNALETLCKLDYVLPFDGPIRYSLPSALKDGCVLFIPGEVSGTTAFDASGNSNHGTLVNSPTPTRGGLWGYKGLKFNGSTQYVTVPDANSLDLTQVTIFAVVNQQSSGRIVTKGYEATNQQNYSIIIENNAAVFRSVGPAGRSYISANGTVPVGVTTSVCASCGNGDVSPKIYINGNETSITANDTSNPVMTISGNSNNLDIGRTTASQQYYGGKISNLIIWNRILNKGEVRILHEAFFIP